MKESTKVGFAFGTMFMVAIILVYAIFPGLQMFLVPEVEPLWTPLLDPRHSAGIVAGIVALGFVLALANRLRVARNTGSPVVPVMVWVVLLAIVGTAIAACISLVAFGLSVEALASLGAPSLIAGAVGLVIAVVVFKLLCPR